MAIDVNNTSNIRVRTQVTSPVKATPDQKALKRVAKAFEASFIAEMLKSAGVGKSRESFGGGAGEEAFSSFLVTAQADKLSEAGGFGLAEKIYQSLNAKVESHGR